MTCDQEQRTNQFGTIMRMDFQHTDVEELIWEESGGEEDVAELAEEHLEFAEEEDVTGQDTPQQPRADAKETAPRRTLPGPADISQSPVEDPQQPHLKAFPQTTYGEKKRSFNKEWYSAYSWIEYSVERDAVFCYACRHFSTANKVTEQSFTRDGFRNWRHAMGKDGKLLKHERSHKAALEAWSEFKQRAKSQTNIGNLLNEAHIRLVRENRHYVKAIAKVLRMTATQKIAQRGHREGQSSMNRGNFLATLNLISEYDTIVASKLSGPCDAKYTHPVIQNELLHVMADTVWDAIREDIEAAGYFSLQVDETKDIHEEFLHFKEAAGLDAGSLFRVIHKTLNDSRIDIQKCVGQCYDGASVMSGANAGVQAKFREVVPQAIYTHCFAHRLNLTLVDSLKSVNLCSEFFAILQKLYVFLSGSFTHQVFLQAQKEYLKDKHPVELKRLSDTRWACQHAACVAVSEALPAVIATLEELAEESNKDRAVEARGLLAVINGSFVVGLVVLRAVLRKTKTLSDHLQARDLDLAEAVCLVDTVIEDLDECRSSEEAWNTLFEEAKVKCAENDIALEKPSRPTRKRSFPVLMKRSSWHLLGEETR
ncbi:zinc finger MYM-type protein 1-like [Apostichopus japonicus]|uniref:zinc finger MYM-type protein 1-like n=1 Tax=Stichopus japonicus TaxID=307972 RepID=UPI003AB3F61E